MALDLWFRGRDQFIPAVGKTFHFVIIGFRSLQLELAHANEINHVTHLANTLF